MFWKILSTAARAAITINRTVTALGAATVIGVGVYDFIRSRRKKQ
jgi:hypothetical protein